MLNYPVEREILEPHVPPGTVLDTYQGKAYVSMVAFLFLKTRVFGVPVPLHTDFEELNLGFYVRRFSGEEWRRGVVFIKEIVPKRAIAGVARLLYNENYVALPMSHEVRAEGQGISVDYRWQYEGSWHSLRASASQPPTPAQPGSLEEFITEHYWGYVTQKGGGCMEYQVEHLLGGLARDRCQFGLRHRQPVRPQVCPLISGPPTSAFIADGSPVTVYRGTKLAERRIDLGLAFYFLPPFFCHWSSKRSSPPDFLLATANAAAIILLNSQSPFYETMDPGFISAHALHFLAQCCARPGGRGRRVATFLRPGSPPGRSP